MRHLMRGKLQVYLLFCLISCSFLLLTISSCKTTSGGSIYIKFVNSASAYRVEIQFGTLRFTLDKGDDVNQLFEWDGPSEYVALFSARPDYSENWIIKDVSVSLDTRGLIITTDGHAYNIELKQSDS